MNPETRARRLERAALNAAQKALKRRPGETLSRDELLALKVQTTPFWLRCLLVILGCSLLLAGIVALAGFKSITLGIVLAAVGVILLCAGFAGRRRPLGTSLDSLGAGITELVIQAILGGLG